MSKAILDASAVLAFLQKEPGETVVRQALRTQECFISTANLAEAASKLIHRIQDLETVRKLLALPNLQVLPVTEEQAFKAAELDLFGKALGLSLGDRICLAVGLLEKAEVLTTDGAWLKLQGGPQVRAIRP